MRICELSKEMEPSWDKYVLNHPDSTFYHTIGWRNVIVKTYKHKQIYLVALEKDEIVGILPLFLMKSHLFGNKLVSLPFGAYGGVCSQNIQIENSLINKAIEITLEKKAKYLELRNLSYNSSDKLVTQNIYKTSILKLYENVDEMFENLKKDKKRAIFKSHKRNLDWEWNNKAENFYHLYSKNMNNLGSPAHSMIFFKNILKEFPNNSMIQVVKKGDDIIYSAFYFSNKDTIINCWSSTLNKYRKYYPTDYGIWNAIQYSIKNGYKFYDFGRSLEGSSNLEFKRRWGVEHVELKYQYFLNKIDKPPNQSSTNPKRQIFAKYWKKAPSWSTNILGVFIRKNLP